MHAAPRPTGRATWRTWLAVVAVLGTVLLAMPVFAAPASAVTTVYVSPSGSDTNPGTEAAPWRTLGKALPQLRPGQTLLVRGGTYRERLTSMALTPGTESARTRVLAYPGERPVVEGLLWLTGASFWDVAGINVTWSALNDSGEHMVKMTGGTGWTFTDAELWGARCYAALLIGGDAARWTVARNYIHDTHPSNGSNQDHLIYANSGTGGGVIERNLLVRSSNGRAVKVGPPSAGSADVANVTIRYNTMVDNTGPSSVQLAWQTSNTRVYRNIMVRPADGRSAVTAYELTGTGNVVSENLTWDAAQPADSGTSGLANGGGNIELDPRFAEPGRGDYRPTAAGAEDFGAYAHGSSAEPMSTAPVSEAASGTDDLAPTPRTAPRPATSAEDEVDPATDSSTTADGAVAPDDELRRAADAGTDLFDDMPGVGTPASVVVHPTPSQVEAAARLVRSAPGARVAWDVRFGTARTVWAYGRDLSAARDGTVLDAARSWLRRNAELFGLTPVDVAGLELTRQRALPGTGTQVVTFRQEFDGLSSTRAGALSVAVRSNGAVLAYTGQTTRDTSLAAAPSLTSSEALEKVTAELVEGADSVPRATGRKDGYERFAGGPFADSSYVKPVAFPTSDGIRPAFRVLFTKDPDAAWDVVVDAATGGLLHRSRVPVGARADAAAPLGWEPYADEFHPVAMAPDDAHDLSNRQAGAADTVLDAHQSGAMRHGWGDWDLMHQSQRKGLDFGSVVEQHGTGGAAQGMRAWPYDVNPTGFGDIGYDAVGDDVHSDGEIWTTILWQLRKALVAQHGEAEGSEISARIVADAVPLSPVEPSFLEMRDAIIKALDNRYHLREDVDEILDLVYGVFASRGAGRDAVSQGSRDVDPRPGFAHIDPARNGTLTGTVVDASTGRPVEDARVIIGVFEARVSPLANTSPTGGFSADMTAGTYSLTVQAAGFGARTYSGVTVTAGSTTGVRLPLEPNLASADNGATVRSATTPGAGALLDDTEASSWRSTSGSGQAIVRLAEESTIRSFQISAFSSSRFEALGSFTLQVSRDGRDWKTVETGRAFTHDAQWPTAPDLHYKSFVLAAPARASYVRLRTDSALSEAATTVQVAELQVFAREAQDVQPLPLRPLDEPVTDSGAIAAGNPGSSTASGVTMADFESICEIPDTRGVDAWVTALPTRFGDGQHRISVVGADSEALYDMDLYFYDATCTRTGSAASPAADESGSLPSGTAYVVTQLWSGAATSFRLRAEDIA